MEEIEGYSGMSKKEILDSLLVKLEINRVVFETAKQTKQKFISELEQNFEYAKTILQLKDISTATDDLTKLIKELSVEIYKENTEAGKSLSNGNVKIQDKTTAKIIDENLAFEWAKKDAPHMLILDEKTLLKHAIAVKDTLPLVFVEIKEEPVATIASEIKFKE